ncbi:MAG: hypothetical protein QFX35_06415 [Candidatus Verstraetearchaeota archaeon]|nr:hypothetical protein [Candidatus Verstraetearchaeota archaeon]
MTSNSEFGEVEERVLHLMASNSNTRFSFQGMKRALKVHQEKLSRGLARLVSMGYVWKDEDGYSITEKGKRLTHPARGGAKKIVVGASYFPGELDLPLVVGQLKGKWFSGMRWLGSSLEGDRRSLMWVSEDGEIQVELNVSGGKFEVALVSYPPNDEPRARECAARIFVKILNSLYNDKPQDN